MKLNIDDKKFTHFNKMEINNIYYEILKSKIIQKFNGELYINNIKFEYNKYHINICLNNKNNELFLIININRCKGCYGYKTIKDCFNCIIL